MIRKSSPRRLSPKRLKALGGKPPYSTIKKRPRKPSEFARIYGSKARVEFVKSLPCAACKVVGYSENAHVLGNGGMGRKGDYTGIAPLCGERPTRHPGLAAMGASFIGCHKQYDEQRWAFDATRPTFDPARTAEATEQAWQESQQ